jgi:hypothetical protein
MYEGIRRCGDDPILKTSTGYKGLPPTKVAVFYGLALGLARIKADYERTGRTAVYCDLGYWTRRISTRHDGYHKLAVNDRHPTSYLMRVPHTPERFLRHRVPIRPWREEGRHILVAGMSAKAAIAEQLRPNQWEQQTIARLRQLTKRPIIYRPKPNWQGASKIDGSIFSRDMPLEEALRDCHAVVTHHSNVGVDALLAGVPIFSEKGAASLLGANALASIEKPLMPDGREQWAANLAYTQWSVAEMRQGLAYRYLLDDGLIT